MFLTDNSKLISNLKTSIIKNGALFLNNKTKNNQITTTYATPTLFFEFNTEKIKNEANINQVVDILYTLIITKRFGFFDKENGLKIFYDSLGNKLQEYQLKNGKINGIVKNFFTNGGIKNTITFLNGKKNGVVKEFDEETGKITNESNYLNDIKNGMAVNYYYVPNNNDYIKESGYYKNNEKEGLWKIMLNTKDKIFELNYHNYQNGKLNGKFKETLKDSIVFGNYFNEKLHGEYKIYFSLISSLFGEPNKGDTTNCRLILKGGYNLGKQNGVWTEYSKISGKPIKNGTYDENKMNGEWNFYYDDINYKSADIDSREYMGKLFLTASYKDDKLNGKYTRYSYMQERRVPCSIYNDSSLNPLDTCDKMYFTKIKETAFYKNDILHGPTELFDSTNHLLYKGVYFNGKKKGFWIEGNSGDGIINYKNFYEYESGKYFNDNRVGIWNIYFQEGRIMSKLNYDSTGNIDGVVVDIDSNGLVNSKYEYKTGYLKNIEILTYHISLMKFLIFQSIEQLVQQIRITIV
jgi:antitoxin component YwqK of YwqJK toxin-antitoxin module